MPLSVTRHAAPRDPDRREPTGPLPTELYLRLGFADVSRARAWAADAIAALTHADPGTDATRERVVVFAPAPSTSGEVVGHGFVYVSELAMRVLRAVATQKIPRPELVSLAQLDPDLEMLAGTEVDRRAYDRWGAGRGW